MAFSKGGILAAWLLAALSLVAAERPRLAVLTDIGGDPDDQQSLIRLMRFFLPLGDNTPPAIHRSRAGVASMRASPTVGIATSRRSPVLIRAKR